MKKEMKLWALTTKEGRILYTAGEKDLLKNYRVEYNEPTFEVELKGEYLVPDVLTV